MTPLTLLRSPKVLQSLLVQQQDVNLVHKVYSLSTRTSLPSPTLSFSSLTRRNPNRNYAINSTLAISRTYSAGRSVAVLNCGPTFAPLVANNNNNVSFALSKKRDQATSFGLAMMLSVLVGVWSVWA